MPNRLKLYAFQRTVAHTIRGVTDASLNTGLAVLDQGVVSGMNFATLAIVGRFAGETALGIYALGATIILLLGQTAEALITGPYTVYLNRMKTDRDEYAGSMILQSFVLAALSAMVLLTVVAVLQQVMTAQSTVTQAISPIVVIAPTIVLREVARRHALAHNVPREALVLDITVGVLQFGALFALASTRTLNVLSTFLSIGGACAIASATYWLRQRNCVRLRAKRFLKDLELNLKLGGWLLASQCTMIAQLTVGQWIVALTLGPAQAGRLTACTSIAFIANPLMTGVGNILLPQAARTLNNEGRSAMMMQLKRLMRIMALAGICYCVGITTFGSKLLSIMFGQRYGNQSLLLFLLSLTFAIRAVWMPIYIGLWVTERPRTNLFVNLAALATIVAVAVNLGRLGLIGIASSMLAGDLLGLVLRWTALKTNPPLVEVPEC